MTSRSTSRWVAYALFFGVGVIIARFQWHIVVDIDRSGLIQYYFEAFLFVPLFGTVASILALRVPDLLLRLLAVGVALLVSFQLLGESGLFPVLLLNFYARAVSVICLLAPLAALFVKTWLVRAIVFAACVGAVLVVSAAWSRERGQLVFVKDALTQQEIELFAAAAGGDVAGTRRLLKKGVDIHARDESGWDALYHAVAGRHATVVAYLLDQGADPNTKEHYAGVRCDDADCKRGRVLLSGESVLMRAVQAEDAESVRLLIANGAVVSAGGHDSSPFATAAGVGNVEILKLLLNAGVTPAMEPEAVRKAARLSETEALRVLLEAGANPDDGIHAAAERMRIQNLKMLIEYGGDPNAVNEFGYTPLLSSGNQDADVFAVLIAAGADVNYVNKSQNVSPQGKSVLMEVVRRGGSSNVVKMLLDAGADPDHQDERGFTALMMARDAPVVAVLLAAGADTSLRNNSGQTALEYARASGRAELIAALSE